MNPIPMNRRKTRFLVGGIVIMLAFLPFIYGRFHSPSFWTVDDSEFVGHAIDAAIHKGFVASSGTWIITDETVVLANMTFIHEGNIIIRGTGQLLLENATLKLQQLASWQFSIRLQDEAVMSLNNSRLKTIYPYRIALFGNAVIHAHDLEAPLIALNSESTMASTCMDSSFLEANTGGDSGISFDACQIERIVTTGDANVLLNNSVVSTLRCYGKSTVNVQESLVGAVHCDGNSVVTYVNSTFEDAWCWSYSTLSAKECEISRVQYYDDAIVSISDSTIKTLIAAGSNPVVLESLSIGEVRLTGYANASLIRCTLESAFCDGYSVLRFYNGSCNRIESVDWADVSVIGTPNMICNVTSFGAYADTSSHISWASFNTIVLGHRTKSWITDSSAYSIYNWGYGGISLFHMARCDIEWELRLAWGVQGTVVNSTIDNGLVYGETSLNASGSEYQSLMVGLVGNASIHNCTIASLLPAGDARIHIAKSNVSWGIQPLSGTSSVFDSLPVGAIGHWNSLESGSIQGLLWNLTASESTMDWHAILRYDSIVEFRNCTLTRIACDESCTVIASNMSIDELVVTRNSDVTVSNSTISDLDCGLWSTSTFMNLLISDLFTIGEAGASFYNCTIAVSLAGGSSTPHFEGCEIGWHRAAGESSSTLTGCILGNFSSYDASVNSGYNSTVLNTLICSHGTILTLSECTINSVYAGDDATTYFYNCSIGNLIATAYSDLFCADSSLEILDCSDFSVLLLSGNLTGIVSFSITDSSSVTRQLEVLVTDNIGQHIEGALVEVYDSDSLLLAQSWTNSEGFAQLEIIFTVSYASLLQTLTLNVSDGGNFYEGQFAITDPLPILVKLGPAPPLAASVDSAHSSIEQSDEADSAVNHRHVSDESWRYLSVLLSSIELIIILQSCAASLTIQLWPVHMLRKMRNKVTRIARMKSTHHFMEVL